MALITESNFDILIESANDEKDFYISGVFSSADVKNKNGRVYPKPILEREIQKLMNESVSNKSCWGELEHPTNRPNTLLERAAILVEELNWHGGDVVGKAIVLDTDHGRQLKALMKHGKVGISSRGIGTVNSQGLVESSFKLLTYDVVSNASNPSSKFVNGIYESEIFKTEDEIKMQDLTNEEEAQKALLEKQNQEKMLQEAYINYKKKVWSVLDKISKEI